MPRSVAWGWRTTDFSRERDKSPVRPGPSSDPLPDSAHLPKSTAPASISLSETSTHPTSRAHRVPPPTHRPRPHRRRTSHPRRQGRPPGRAPLPRCSRANRPQLGRRAHDVPGAPQRSRDRPRCRRLVGGLGDGHGDGRQCPDRRSVPSRSHPARRHRARHARRGRQGPRLARRSRHRKQGPLGHGAARVHPRRARRGRDVRLRPARARARNRPWLPRTRMARPVLLPQS